MSASALDFRPLYKRINHVAEYVEAYREGGFHPIHIGDSLANGRYTIMRKLGFGSYSTVWLAKDERLSKFLAIKVCTANTGEHPAESDILRQLSDESANHPGLKHILLPLETFTEVGPNGAHDCLVMDLMTTDEVLSDDYFREPCSPQSLQTIAKQMLLALDCVHSTGFVHSDLQKGNILRKPFNLDNLTEQQILSIYPKQVQCPVQRLDGQPLDAHAPRYIVSTNLDRSNKDSKQDSKEQPGSIASDTMGSELELPLYKLCDFGECFKNGEKRDFFTTPEGLRAPEIHFGFADPDLYNKIDIWALGCTLYELFIGCSMFEFSGAPLPISECEELIKLQILSNFTDRLGNIPPELVPKFGTMKKYVDEQGKLRPSEEVNEVQSVDTKGLASLILDGVKKSKLCVETLEYIDQVIVLPQDQRQDFLDLLTKMLDWNPANRPTARELLSSKWF